MCFLLLLACLLPSGSLAVAQVPAPAFALEAIDWVWSGHAVRFAIATTPDRVFVAYYDANRQLSVASRTRRGTYWVYHKLDSWTGWDSHNAVALTVDNAGHLHLVANLHNDPLVYFRTTIAGDVRSLRRTDAMADPAAEWRMTYPVFLRDAAGGLLFKYRDGGSGNGNEVVLRYDVAATRWRALTDRPLMDGEGLRNAYVVGPTLGPDGWFHLAWVWRDTPDAATNHDLSYARSRDLVRWERSDGASLSLPIRLGTAEIVDPVPVRGGMINNNTVVGFDPAGRVTITFHKFDARGDTQIFVARRDPSGWTVAQASDWRDFRWDFGGGGSLVSRVFVSGAEPLGTDRIRVPVVRDGRPVDLILDAATLRRVEERPGILLADRLSTQIVVPKGMQLNTVEDGSGLAIGWPTRPPQRDLAAPDIPEPTVLRLVSPR